MTRAILIICAIANLAIAAPKTNRPPQDVMRDFKGKDPATRAKALRELSTIGAEGVPVIVEELKANKGLDRDSKILLAKMLGNSKDQRGDEVFGKMLKEERDPLVRQAAVIGMGQSLRAEHTPALKERLDDRNEDLTVRMRAAWALGRMGDKTGERLALDTLKNTRRENATAQYLAVEALEVISEESVIPELERNWKNPSAYAWTRIWSKLAARRIQFNRAASSARVRILEEALSDPQFEVNEWAAVTLRLIGSEDAMQVLSRAGADPGHAGNYAAAKQLRLILHHGARK